MLPELLLAFPSAQLDQIPAASIAGSQASRPQRLPILDISPPRSLLMFPGRVRLGQRRVTFIDCLASESPSSPSNLVPRSSSGEGRVAKSGVGGQWERRDW